MGKEAKAEKYKGNGYMKPGVFNKYLPLYKKAVSYLPSPEKSNIIIDLGCGVGYFAKVVFEAGYKNYIGIDFSQDMIKKAKKQVPDATFILGDLRDKEIYKIFQNHKIFVILETLEHITKDIDIIKNIPQGSLVIFSVPNYDHEFHVRLFKTIKDVIKRFGDFLIFKENWIKENKKKKSKIFLFKCIRK